MSSRSGIRILVIEDDEASLRVFRLILESGGYTLDVAVNRSDGLVIIKANPPDALIMDYRVGGIAASAFLDELRSTGFVGHVLLCTAEHEDHGLNVDDVLYKPFDPEELERRVSTLLGQ